MKKGIILTLACLATITSFTAKSIYACDIQPVSNSNENTEIQPRKDILEWIHTTINGKNINAFGTLQKVNG